ncbi:MAG: hypothetical protein JO112_23750 [Planctomycetes bacterium]|nr:hypothetical protein [Planctomycetota bacterium]
MRTFVAGNQEALSAQIREVFLREGHECQVSGLEPLEVVTSRLAKAQPELVVVVLSPQPGPALQLLGEIRATIRAQLVAVGRAHDAKLRLSALRAGADHYLDENQFQAELEVILARQQTPRQTPAEPLENGKLISVLAPSGGSGCSTIAVNLAALLAREHKKCALFDLKLGGGDLAALLDVKPTHTLADLCKNSPRMDRVMFELSLNQHDCGVQLLSPPRSFADISHVTTQGVRQALTLARTLFPYVVIDLDDSFHPEQTQTLNQSDLILLLLRLDFTSLRNTRRALEQLDQLTISREKVRLVVNRYGQPEELPASKAEQALGVKVFHYIPDDPKTINRANNNGIPAVLESPSAKFSKSLSQLAVSVNGRKTR